MKKILMVAGPNGAGKTTMVLELLADDSMLYEFINADEIAKSLSPLHPESMALAASKLMIKRLKELLKETKNFAFETTASGKNYIKYLKEAKLKGYEINVFFLYLASPEQAIKRVAQRVRHGGHHIPKKTILRRYHLGLKNFLIHYLPIVDRAIVINNSKEQSRAEIIMRKNLIQDIEIFDKEIWEEIMRSI